MKDEEFEELVSNGNPSVAVISPCKLKGDIKMFCKLTWEMKSIIRDTCKWPRN